MAKKRKHEDNDDILSTEEANEVIIESLLDDISDVYEDAYEQIAVKVRKTIEQLGK